MFEAKILQGQTLKKIIEAIRELVVDANLDCTENGIAMQVESLLAFFISFG
jgi:proliferating cell nuclear antigen